MADGAMVSELRVSVQEGGKMNLWLTDEDGEVEVVASGEPEAVAKAAFEALGIVLATARRMKNLAGA